MRYAILTWAVVLATAAVLQGDDQPPGPPSTRPAVVNLKNNQLVQKALAEREKGLQEAEAANARKVEALKAEHQGKLDAARADCVAALRRAEAVSIVRNKQDEALAIKALGDSIQNQAAPPAATQPATVDLGDHPLVQKALADRDKANQEADADYAKKLEALKVERQAKQDMVNTACVFALHRAEAASNLRDKKDEALTIKALADSIQSEITPPPPPPPPPKEEPVAIIGDDWVCYVGRSRRPGNCQIILEGEIYTLINERGSATTAKRPDAKTLVDQHGMRGQISPDGRKIQWSNGSSWQR